MAAEAAHWRFTVQDFHKMAEAGILCEDDRVELIDGEVVEMSPIGDRHIASVNRSTRVLHRTLPEDDFIVSTQNPIQLGQNSEPQPDVAVVRYRADFYSGAKAKAADVLFVIEVADSSLSYDRRTKLPLYAAAGIPESWLLDIEGEALERHTDPSSGRYGVVVRVGRGKELASTTVDGLVLRVDDLLG